MAISSGTDVSGEELLRRADLAMYTGKNRGKNRTVQWEPGLEQRATADQQLAAELHEAIDHGQLVVHYQPILSVATGQIRAFEALVRWQHPTRGLLPPDGFIPLAERIGAIEALTLWVLRQACWQAKQWHDRRPDQHVVMCVNLSGSELGRPELTNEIVAVLETTGLPPELLELEITETALVDNFDAARRALQELKCAGIRIAIDDFGTGYSSLSCLHELPADRLKIDKSFIDRLRFCDDDELIRGLIFLAHSLHLEVTAEGIEALHQHDVLVTMGCDDEQGYLFGRPMPAAHISWPLSGLARGVDQYAV